MKYHITRDELYRLLDCAKGRNEAKDPSWSRRKSGVFSDFQLDALGLVGEYAAAKVCGVDIDWSIHSHGDGGKDLELPGSKTAAVKYNHRKNGFVMVEGRRGDTANSLADLNADIIIGTHGDCNPPHVCECSQLWASDAGHTVEVAGWLDTPRFIEIRTSRDLGLGMRHFVRVEQLEPIEHLLMSFPVETTKHWIRYGKSLSLVAVDSHNRCAELPPPLAHWRGMPWSSLCSWASRNGKAEWGVLAGDDLLSLAEAT